MFKIFSRLLSIFKNKNETPSRYEEGVLVSGGGVNPVSWTRGGHTQDQDQGPKRGSRPPRFHIRSSFFDAGKHFAEVNCSQGNNATDSCETVFDIVHQFSAMPRLIFSFKYSSACPARNPIKRMEFRKRKKVASGHSAGMLFLLRKRLLQLSKVSSCCLHHFLASFFALACSG